jgi:DNA-binding NtrC family response regulator
VDLSGKRILIVEDEPLIALELREVMEEAALVPVGPVGRVSDALEVIRARGCDAALIDFQLGSETSTPVADALAAQGVPFAFVTGYGDDAIPEAHRGRPLIRKPYVVSHLVEQARLLLE